MPQASLWRSPCGLAAFSGFIASQGDPEKEDMRVVKIIDALSQKKQKQDKVHVRKPRNTSGWTGFSYSPRAFQRQK